MDAVRRRVKVLVASAGMVVWMISSSAGAQAISPTRLVEMADLSSPVISPDGRRVAFRVESASVARNAYESVWYVQDLDGGVPPRKVGDGGVPLRDSAGVTLPATVHWSPDGRYVYYMAMLGSRVDIWRAAADGSGAEPLTFDPADVRDFALAEDGRTLKYSVGATHEEVVRAEQAEYERGIRVDESVPVGAPLFRSSLVTGRAATQRYTGAWFARGPLLAHVPDRWRELDLESGTSREVEPPREPPSPGSLDLPDGMPAPSRVEEHLPTGRIALVTPLAREDGAGPQDAGRLSVLIRSPTGRLVECQAEACVGKWITGTSWLPDGQELLFTVTSRKDGLAQSIFRWNIATRQVHLVMQSTGLVNGGRNHRSDCGVSAKVLACVVARADHPPRLEKIDVRTGRNTVLFDPNAALAADFSKAVSVRLLQWSDNKGTAYSGQLFIGRARGATKQPLFITYYFCPGFLRGGLGDEWPLASLAERGILALCINAPPYQPDPVGRYNQGLEAITRIVDELAAEGLVDSSRVGMGGLSFGSEMALWAAVETDLLAAVSVTSPSASPLYALMGSLKGDVFSASFRRGWGLGSVDETPEQWKRVSPAFNVERIQAPVLFQMPEEEYLYGLDYIVPLIKAGRADLYVFPDEPHQKFQPRHKVAAYERNIDWFRFWLQGFEDQSARKAGQYRHWRELTGDSVRHASAGEQGGP
ncbi:Atxe2 family lasso peptide isopeptidase [Lysobacter sp. GX 14042]|uniref:Atxe2 family lasso peptide isopeptidase n=1 Tax=Lysobacter sp. GX 14042 TaxID=2907155 RepID=UPI001F39F84D|nr:Atxe2 family lasso peptide isopeptidase [Lysobacter sp. GX 14042]MCE7032893.1 Atxe2 family lasso peptide isopeptidase [Lysobacter sp. GX 14042]